MKWPLILLLCLQLIGCGLLSRESVEHASLEGSCV